jgi:hypothetical protein
MAKIMDKFNANFTINVRYDRNFRSLKIEWCINQELVHVTRCPTCDKWLIPEINGYTCKACQNVYLFVSRAAIRGVWTP